MKVKDDCNYKLISNRFPKIGLGIEIRWGTKDLEEYIENLLYDTREHTRQGFPKEIAEALTSLLLLHNKEYPEHQKPPDSVWDINYFN